MKMRKGIFAIIAAALMILVGFGAISCSADPPEKKTAELRVQICSIRYSPDGHADWVYLNENEMKGIYVVVIQNDLNILDGTTAGPDVKRNDYLQFENLYQGHTYLVRATKDGWKSPVDGKEYTFSGTAIATTATESFFNPNAVSGVCVSMTGILKEDPDDGGDTQNDNAEPVILQKIPLRLTMLPLLRAFLTRLFA